MLRLSLLISGLISFWYFLNPASFGAWSETGDKVLGIQSLNQAVNRQAVYTAVLAFCLDNQTLPENLNQLYEKEIDDKNKIDLNELYSMETKNSQTCEFQLTPK